MKRLTMHRRFLLRELSHGWRHGLLFVLCAALSLTTMASLNSFKGAVNHALFRDARALHGGDIILHSHYPFSAPLQAEVERLEAAGQAEATVINEFYSVVRDPENDQSLLTKIKAVEEEFPLYGEIELKSGGRLSQVLRSSTCVVAEDVLRRLGLQVGDGLAVGSARLTIVDIVTHESDNPSDFLDFGPRVFVAQDDLERIDLVKKGSRVQYEILLKLDEQANLARIAAALKESALENQERVNTFRDASSRIKRFFDNLLFFLSLIAIFTLLLAGLGMQSCLTALIRQKEKTIAVARTVGATSAFLYRHYLVLVLILGLAGIILGIVSGVALSAAFPYLFKGLLPIIGTEGEWTLQAGDLGEGLILGLAVILLFTFLPLHRLRNIRPVAIFRKDKVEIGRDAVFYLALGAGLALVTLLVIRQLEDRLFGLLFMGGLLLFVTLVSLFATLLFSGAKKLMIRNLGLRQAVRSMTRTGNATRSIIITLASALALLFANYLVEKNLYQTYVKSYPSDAPNLFFLDIQPDQRQGFAAFFEQMPPLYPIIRARLLSINGTGINRAEELQKKRDNLAREFNLTYRDYLLDDEIMLEGESLFKKNWNNEDELQVSILDTVAEMGDMKIGDRLLFNIQGVELAARVVSVRSRTESRLYPFFYFVFPGDTLEGAPQTFFSAMRIDRDRIAGLQNRIVAEYPNISFINVSDAAENIGELMLKLSVIVNFFGSFSILAGALILVSSILATRLARTREAVYYKILGGRTGFVYRIFLYENIIVGLTSGGLALLFAHCIGWVLCRYVFDIAYNANVIGSLVLIAATVGLVVVTGFASSLAIVRQKPARFLREHGNG